jgi:hypothetical protein
LGGRRFNRRSIFGVHSNLWTCTISELAHSPVWWHLLCHDTRTTGYDERCCHSAVTAAALAQHDWKVLTSLQYRTTAPRSV